MSMTDPIADMLTRIRNGIQSRHDRVEMPSSKLKVEVAKILKSEGFISNYKVVQEDGKPQAFINWERRVAESSVQARYTVDKGPAHVASWRAANDGTATVIDQPAAFIKSINDKRTLSVELLTSENPPQTTFNIDILNVGAVARACPG